MRIVQIDLAKYLQRNIFPSRTVLVFPPFNGFRRFLIHKLIEDNLISKDLAAFSIGQDIARRIVVCYKGLISNDQNKKLENTLNHSQPCKMIDKDKQCSKQKLSPTVAVYRPPAARMAESRQQADTSKPDQRRTRVRRPDQQVYVPRARRSLNNSDESNQSLSSSRTSLDLNSSDIVTSTKCETTNRLDLDKNSVNMNQSPQPLKKTSLLKSHNDGDSMANSSKPNLNNMDESAIASSRNKIRPFQDIGLSETNHSSQPNKVLSLNDDPKSLNTLTCCSRNNFAALENHSNSVDCVNIASKTCEDDMKSEPNNPKKQETKQAVASCKNIKLNSTDQELNEVSTNSKAMDIISISSESRCDQSSSSEESISSHSSCESEVEKYTISNQEQNLILEEHHTGKSDKEHAEGIVLTSSHDSTVFTISDSSSDSFKSTDSDVKEVIGEKKTHGEAMAKKKAKLGNPDDCDWESLYDDSGECLVPNLMQELTNSVGRVKVASADSDYRTYQTIEERTNDGECVIEIYDFPSEFKTTDLFNIFAAYRSKHFQIKWVDDTHALGVFSSPIIADEVLACTLPFVKTRPLRLGIPESKSKARNLVLPVLPPMERPKTCPALARRLVSGALGLRLPTSLQDREKEKQVLKEAREKRRLEAKQREAAWDGTLTSIL